MIRSPEQVRKATENDATIETCLAGELIDVRALARCVQASESCMEDEVTYEALVNAIRRYPTRLHSVDFGELRRYFVRKRATMKNNIADVMLIKDSDTPATFGKLSSQIDYGRGETLHVVAGVETTRLVFDERNLKKMSGIIPKKNIAQVETNLSEIVISMDPD